MKTTIESTILDKRDVGTAISMIKKRCAELSISEGKECAEAIDEEYHLMCDFFMRGMRDPNGDEVYENLLRRTYFLYNTVRLASIIKHRVSLSACKNIADRRMSQSGLVSAILEQYVQNMAMLSLQPSDLVQEEREKLCAEHQTYMEHLFCSIIVSGQWSREKADSYVKLTVSPFVDNNDSLLLVSALTLALLVVGDVNKWLALVGIFEHSNSEELRQRALVGVALTLPHGVASLFPEIADAVKRLCSTDNVRRQLVDLQVQLLCCERAESDSAEFQRDMMTPLVNGGVFGNDEINKLSKECLDGVPYGDSYKEIADIEKRVAKIRDMQKRGSDIYFGGFSKMKNFSFFCQISNWFVPFCTGHPQVVSALRIGDAERVADIASKCPFCDSDKYSFVFAMVSMFGKLPDKLKKMIADGDPNVLDADGISTNKPAYIRRVYLQNVYRFFSISTYRNDFANPFSSRNVYSGMALRRLFFVADSMLVSLFGEEFDDLVLFMYNSKMYEPLRQIVSLRHDAGKASSVELRLWAQSCLRVGLYGEALDIYNHLYSVANTVASLRGIAYSHFMLRHYVEAASAYGTLAEQEPGNSRTVLYRGLALVNSGHVEYGMADIFKLNYDYPNDRDVKRALAWGYLMRMEPNKAEPVYDMLVNENSHVALDILNCAYTKLILSKIEEAVMLFRRYVAQCGGIEKHSIAEDFKNDRDMLKINGVKDFEIMIIMEQMKVQ